MLALALMRHLLACFLLLAISVAPTLGTPHAHTLHGESVAAVQHTHGIGLDHGCHQPVERHEDGEPPCGTQNLDGDQLVLAERVAGSAPISLRVAAGWQARSAVAEVLADRPPTAVDGFSGNGLAPPSRDQLEVRITAPRRGPPQPSV